MWNVCFLSYIEIKVPSMNTLYSLNSPNLTQMYHILEQVDSLFNLFGTAAKYSAPLFSTILPILDRSSGSGSGFGFLMKQATGDWINGLHHCHCNDRVTIGMLLHDLIHVLCKIPDKL